MAVLGHFEVHARLRNGKNVMLGTFDGDMQTCLTRSRQTYEQAVAQLEGENPDGWQRVWMAGPNGFFEVRDLPLDGQTQVR
jgi:hypothetical protein